jgi:hypothetical protein
MDSDERDIEQYLATWGETYVSAKEICRRAGSRKRYNAEPEWAREVLLRMEEKGIVESNANGKYRLIHSHSEEGEHEHPPAGEVGEKIEGADGELPPDEHHEQH